MSEDREWTLNNVEEVRVNTKDIDEICFGLEQLTIFATETIQNFATDILKLHQENQQLKEQLKDENNYHNEAVKWYKEAFDIEQERIKYRNVLDEIRDVLNNQMNYREFVDIVNAIEEILDKVKEDAR